MTTQPSSTHVESAYGLAQERYAALGVDTEQALAILRRTPVSINCWQGDDVIGFENPKQAVIGGIMATGNYPGRARNVGELRSDLDLAFSLLPGTHRLNLQANYLETHGQDVPRSQIEPRHFADWVDWAKANNHGLDLNPTLFSHPLVEEGFTLAHPTRPSASFGWTTASPAARSGPILARSWARPASPTSGFPTATKTPPWTATAPACACGTPWTRSSPSRWTPNSTWMRWKASSLAWGWKATRLAPTSSTPPMPWPTRSASVSIPATSTPRRPSATRSRRSWPLCPTSCSTSAGACAGTATMWSPWRMIWKILMQEIVRGGFLDRVNIGVDFFDASINRIAAWVIGGRNVQRALLMALLEPLDHLRQLELDRDLTGRFVFLEELKGLPFGAVWDYFCLTQEVPVGAAYVDEIRGYEKRVLANRK